MSDTVKQEAVDVSFAEIESALGKGASQAESGKGPGRALTATVVVIGPHERLADAAPTLEVLGASGAVRAIVIPQNADARPSANVTGNVVNLLGLQPPYVDNAVAALRLSSLPTLIWWRGGDPDALDSLSALADRIVLDADPPEPSWARASALLERVAFSDLRWTRLTRWRALMAQFFDLPQVLEAASTFRHLRIEGADRSAAELFGGWMKAMLQWSDRVSIDVHVRGSAPIESIIAGNGTLELSLRLAGSRRCVETAARYGSEITTSRVVSLGSQSLTALLSEELRIRSRDTAFERAMRARVAA